MVKVGQRIMIDINVYVEPGSKRQETRMERGTVIYVHPQGRFHTVEILRGDDRLRYTVDGVG